MSKLLLLPDDILEKQICTNCFQYLSVLPVNQNRKGEIYCGRCQEDFEKSIEHIPALDLKFKENHTSMFDDVAKNYLFKCVYHYEGCKQLLDVSSSVEHEEACLYQHLQPHECFFCSFQGNFCQILHHSLQEHSGNITKNGLIQFNVGCNFSQQLMFIVRGNIFLLTIEMTDEHFSLIISPKVVDDLIINQFALQFFIPSDTGNADLMFTDYSLFDINSINYFKKSSKEFITRFGLKTYISCQILLKQVELSQKELDLEKRFIDLNVRENDLLERDALIKNREIELMERRESVASMSSLLKKLSFTFLRCVNCKTIVADVAFFCEQNHCYCEACLSTICQTCQTPCEFTKFTEPNKIIVTCDWPNCKKTVKLGNYLYHKSNCLFRPYKCPLNECFETVYSHCELVSHWHCRIPPLISDNVIEYDKYGEHEFYWLIDTNVFHVVIRFLQDNFMVIIEKICVLANNFKFKIEGYYNAWENQIGSNFCEKYIVNSRGITPSGYRYSRARISFTER